jgi:tetratricopeptide (TPR) repeat protein
VQKVLEQAGAASPESRGLIGNPLLLVALLLESTVVVDEATFMVALTVAAAHDVVEAIRRRTKVKKICMPLLHECLDTVWQNGKRKECERCKERPATSKYTRQNHSMMLCAACLDRMAVQDALEDRLRHIVDLEDREQYDEALACLDEILEANRHLDHEKWLARNIARDRATILRDAGRYAEAEQACKAWADIGITDVWGRWMYGSVTADVLDALGRPQEGLAVLDEALSHRDPEHVGIAWDYLRDLAKLSEKLGQPVDPKFRSLAQETAERNGVEMPKHESLGEAILDLAKTIVKTNRARRGEEEPDEDDDNEV